MGCVSGTNSYQPLEFQSKVLIWILGGGPGSPKQHISTYLTQQYQFKYISVIELIHFEEKAQSPEATEIRKNIEEKKQYSASLIIKLIKKFITSFGPRKYLLDNFPRNQKDAVELTQFCKKYSDQVSIQGYIQLELEEQQMREDGIKTLKQIKKDQKDQNIQIQVRNIIQSYRTKIIPLLQYYKSKSLLSSFSLPNNDINQLITNVSKNLSSRNITAIRNVSFYFVDSNNSKQLKKVCLIVSRKFGIKFWSIQQLIQQLKTYPQTFKQVNGKKVEQVNGPLLVQIIFKKLKKYNYKGKYIISGFPRNQTDYELFQAKFAAQIKLELHFSFLKSPTQKEEQSFTKLHKRLLQTQQINSKLIISPQTPIKQLQNSIEKTLPSIKKRQNLKIGLFPCIQDRGYEYAKKMMEWCEMIDFKQLLNEQIKKDKIYSDLLKSNIALDQPISGVIYSEIFRSKVNEYKGTKPLIFKNLPQNLEQLKLIIQKTTQIHVLFALFMSDLSNNDSKTWRVPEYHSICEHLEHYCDKFIPINVKTTYQQLKSFIDSL